MWRGRCFREDCVTSLAAQLLSRRNPCQPGENSDSDGISGIFQVSRQVGEDLLPQKFHLNTPWEGDQSEG